MSYRDDICNAVDGIRTEAEKELDEFYGLGIEELRQKEHSSLIAMSLDVVNKSLRIMPETLKKAGIPLPNLTWKQINEEMPLLSYVYIDWDSANKNYSFNTNNNTGISNKDMDRINKGHSVLIVGGCLIAGTVAVIYILSKGNPVGIVVSVLAAAGGGIILKKVYDLKTQAPDKSVPHTPADHLPEKAFDPYECLIKAAKKQNLDALHEWCRKLEKRSLEICDEVMKDEDNQGL